jgi:type IV pilus modification protein PilV
MNLKTRGQRRGKPGCYPGFTLMEVMIAMFLIVVSVIALISLLSAGMTMDRTSNNNTAAALVAKGLMEQMLANTDFQNVDTVYDDASTVRRQVNYNGDTTTYTYNWTIYDAAAPYSVNYYKEYIVNVYWQGQNSSYTTSITLITTKSNN